MYQDYNDYEIISLAKENNEEAMNIIFNKYMPIIVNLSNDLIRKCGYIGMDKNDLIQEGRIGLFKAIIFYDCNNNCMFYSFAKRCIESRLFNVIKSSRTSKCLPLNSSMQYFNCEAELERFNIEVGNYEKILDNNIEKDYHLLAMNNFIDFEYQVFELKVAGFSYKDISILLDKSIKSIDNTLQRIRQKLKRIIDV